MAEYTSGMTYFNGLGNGTDFSTMIDQLKSIEMMPAKKLLKWKADWQQRQDAFKLVRTQLVNLRSIAGQMGSIDKFMVKGATSATPEVATATAGSQASEGIYRLEVGQLATNSIWSIDTGFNNTSASVNNSGAAVDFTYTYAGKARTISVPSGTSLEGLKNLINNDNANPGARVALIKGADGYTFQMRGMDTGFNNSLHIVSAPLDAFPATTYGQYSATYLTDMANKTDIINKSGGATDFAFSYNGAEHKISVPANASLEWLESAVNGLGAGVSASASVVPGSNPPVYAFILTGDDPGKAVTVKENSFLTGVNKPFMYTQDVTGWHTQQSKDAMIRVNGWPANSWFVTSSNTVDTVAEGMTFNLKNEGTSVITVSIDTPKVKENITSFVDAVNALRTTIMDLTKYDETKQVKDPEYSDSQFTMQKGSVLTGNYGIQLLSSQLKQATAGVPLGFDYYHKYPDGSSTGDIYSALSQLGIKTQAEGGMGAPDFGLLVFETDPSLPTLDKVLAENPQAVAEFFAAQGLGVSESGDFSFVSQMQDITEPGIYDIKYEVKNEGGKMVVYNATINGKEAKYDPETGQLGVYSSTPPPNPADGTVVHLDNLAETTPGNPRGGRLRIKQGKIVELLKMLDGPKGKYEEGMLGTKGALGILERNYNEIMANIDTKVAKEDARIIKWERVTRLRFSRLEATLKRYDSLSKTVEAQVKQLSSSSK